MKAEHPVSPPDTGQIIQFNTLLGALKIKDMKRQLIAEATNGRTDHTKEMTADELQALNRHLQQKQNDLTYAAGQKQRRRIMALCHQLPEHLGFTEIDSHSGERHINLQKLDDFLKGPKSIYKKRLKYHTPPELSRVIVQFENMLKGYLK